LDEAVKYAENEGVLGRTLQYLAQAQLKMGRGEDAQRVGYDAIAISPYGERAVEARTSVALIERELGNESAYNALLIEAAEIAERDRVGGQSLAKLLNMAASSQRRAGDLLGALALAKRSLAIGRRLNDRRHVAHAAHTLAAIKIDLIPGSPDIPADLDEARKLLEESRTTLVRLRDAHGIELVDASLRRLSGVATSLEFPGGEA
jgi:tetratricopeptide (TPR) repeat protein